MLVLKPFSPGRNLFSRAGNPFLQQGKSFSRAQKPFTLRGKPLQRAGNSFSQRGKSFSRAQKSFTLRGKSFSRTGKRPKPRFRLILTYDILRTTCKADCFVLCSRYNFAKAKSLELTDAQFVLRLAIFCAFLRYKNSPLPPLFAKRGDVA